jgi:putative inorganic carbon (HCO3(-)) transporter
VLSKADIRQIGLLTALFVGTNAYLLFHEIYWFSLIPVVIAILGVSLLSLEKIFYFLIFTTPLSLNLEKLEMGGIGMFIPTEPILFFIMVLFFIRMFMNFNYDKRVLLHPITLIILLQVSWMLICTFTSVRPIISLKYVISRMWFLVSFYFIAIQLFKNPEKIRQYLWFYLIPLTGVIIYTVVNHYLHGFDDKPAHFVMKPFFKDHTSYGAVLAMYVPMVIYLIYYYDKFSMKFYTSTVFIILMIGVIFSYTRAAWVSLAGGAVLWLIYKLRIKFRYLVMVAGVFGFLLYASWGQLMMSLEKNRKESSGNLTEHIQSASNITSDASNLERINRWESALKMFKEKPVFGWGPGTYSFEYAPFQHSQSLTIISTNAGKLGNAHSEYIGPLAESGVMGSLTVILLFSFVFYYGSKVYHSLPKGKDKALVLATIIGFSTYAAHGLLNNYLDTDKASVPFWGFIGIIVAYDVYQKGLLKSNTE